MKDKTKHKDVYYAIDPEVDEQERKRIIKMVRKAMKNKKRIQVVSKCKIKLKNYENKEV